MRFDVCVTVHHWYNNINSQLDTTIVILLTVWYAVAYAPAYQTVHLAVVTSRQHRRCTIAHAVNTV